MGLGYDAWDLFNDSEMEMQRDKYKYVYDKVTEKLEDVNARYEQLKNWIKTQNIYMDGWDSDIHGKISDDYDATFKTYTENINDIYGIFDGYIGKINKALENVKEQYEYYKEQARLEGKGMDPANEVRFNVERIENVISQLQTIDEEIQDAFSASQTLFDTLEGEPLWSGEERDAFMSYYHLLLQYHGQLSGNSVQATGSVSTVSVDGNPIEKIKTAFSEMLINLESLPEESKQYKELLNKNESIT